MNRVGQSTWLCFLNFDAFFSRLILNSVFVSVGNVAASRRRQHAVTVGKERRESLVRAKRLCRVGVGGDGEAPIDSEMMIDEEQSILESQTSLAVEELKSAVAYQYAFPLF